MSQTNLIHSYKVKPDLWFNLVPVKPGEILKKWTEYYRSLEDKCVYGTDGYYIFGDVLARVGRDKDVDFYIFTATQNKFERLTHDSNSVEMMMSVTISNGVYQPIGIQRYEVPSPHKNISIMAHAFCAEVTQKLGAIVIITVPLKVMREKFASAFAEKGETLAITTLPMSYKAPVSYRANDGKIYDFSKALPANMNFCFPGNSPDRKTPKILINIQNLAALWDDFSEDQIVITPLQDVLLGDDASQDGASGYS